MQATRLALLLTPNLPCRRNLIEPQKEGFSECTLGSISSSPRLCFDEFLKELCAATTSPDDRRNRGFLARDRVARFDHELPD